ncbi:MAG: VWA domain-containing protein [Gaiellaceae bacterium]
MRLGLAAGFAALVAAVVALPAAGAGGVTITPVGRVPFPERGFVVDLPKQVAVGNLSPKVLENGVPVRGASLTPVGASELSFGTILAVDASDSMAGKPFAAAVAAAGTFVGHRTANEQIGLVAFNKRITVVQRLTANPKVLRTALAHRPSLAYGTRIYDALAHSLGLLEQGRISAGSIVLLSDGADVGSRSDLASLVARARRDRVRIFTVGLRSGAFKARPLQQIAAGTGGVFAEAASTSQLGHIYGELSGKLASEYLLEYRSNVKPGTPVNVRVDLAGLGAAHAGYVAPIPSGLAPFHRSLATQFFLSGFSLVVLSLLAAALAGGLLFAILSRPRSGLLARVGQFVNVAPDEEDEQDDAERRRRSRRRRLRSEGGGSLLTRMEREFEIGEITIAPMTFLAGTAALTVVLLVLLAMISGPLAVLAILVPIFARAWVSRQVKAVRDAFADQLPETLQLLASALRSGHSLIGALSVVVDQAPEPTKREFTQVLTDDQLGVPIERAMRNVADRMKSRDMQQVALLGELQRTAGGNAAEVLDTVVETVRERAEIRRLAKTLTAQGRMARWVLSLLPIVLVGLMFATSSNLVRPFLASGGGQIALVFAALMVVAGSFWIKKIVEIEV